MKRSKTSQKKKKALIPGENISRKIVNDYIRFNLIFLAVLCFVCLLIHLLVNYYQGIYAFLEEFLGHYIAQQVAHNTFVIVLIVYPVMLLLSGIYFSIGTLVIFNKTWRSLSAILTDEVEIKKFPKKFSEVEIALKDIKHDVFKSQQLAAQSESRKNDLVMYLAHDLKTPLTSIIGYLTLLSECPELPPAQRAKYVNITLEKAYRLEQLISEFFEISRFNINSITLEKNRIDLGMMLNQIVDEFYPMLIEKNLTVEFDIIQKIVMIADSDKIARVLDNLLKNAVAYSYENSTIKVGARIIKGKVMIKFRNHCDEIPKDKLDRIFEKFFRADSSRTSSSGGSGLGLAIAKQIVELHGGKIFAKSTVNYTDFSVVLPYIDAEEIDESYTQME